MGCFSNFWKSLTFETALNKTVLDTETMAFFFLTYFNLLYEISSIPNSQ